MYHWIANAINMSRNSAYNVSYFWFIHTRGWATLTRHLFRRFAKILKPSAREYFRKQCPRRVDTIERSRAKSIPNPAPRESTSREAGELNYYRSRTDDPQSEGRSHDCDELIRFQLDAPLWSYTLPGVAFNGINEGIPETLSLHVFQWRRRPRAAKSHVCSRTGELPGNR